MNYNHVKKIYNQITSFTCNKFSLFWGESIKNDH